MTATRNLVEIEEIVWFVQSKYGKDLTKYRSSCLGRRIGLRMTSVGAHDLDEYMDYLEKHPIEADRLLEVVTIHVTDFFRDRSVFDAMSHKVFPEIIGKKLLDGMNVIRAWSAGCSTGEETYSLAIGLLDILRKDGVDLRLQIFGTDISEEACSFAAKGMYPDRKVCAIPGDLLKRYFELDDGYCKVKREVMRRVKFRVHDLFSRPPFGMLDLIVCRNVLIHFNHNARSTVLKYFNSALNNGGILVLGKSEAITGEELGVFELTDARNKIYRKVAESAR
jgi:two-component system CheB/CheR fusion protein